MTECPICLGPHDPQTHAATLRIRGWLRARLERVLEPPLKPRRTQPPHPNQFFLKGSGRP
jgi:hypothetical protein